MGGFDGTSNVLAGYLFGVPIKGTHAHSYVQSFTAIQELKDDSLVGADGKRYDFIKMVLDIRAELISIIPTKGNLLHLLRMLKRFPNGFLALVDTYDTMKSGVPNCYLCGPRTSQAGLPTDRSSVDSGDLSYLSRGNKEDGQ